MTSMECESSTDYFESYDNLGVHQLMLMDKPRNNAYRQAIFDNKADIEGKVVLDVGAGTGILSLFCAQAGAAKVYAVEASQVYKIAEEVAKENGFEGVIEVIHSQVENVILPQKVDVLVSEWMGFYLLHEGMLDSVLKARDKFLKPGGLMFPDTATIYAAPCSVPSMFDFWNNVDGVSMTTFAEKLRREASRKPITASISPTHILADPEVVEWLDLRDQPWEQMNTLVMEHIAVAKKPGKYQGICLWFTVTFPSSSTEPVTLSTGPNEPKTHWRQTIIVLPREMEVENGTPIAYELTVKRSMGNPRRYDLEVEMLDPEDLEHSEYCSCHLTKCILVRAMLDKYAREARDGAAE